jgi:hypothetical protein
MSSNWRKNSPDPLNVVREDHVRPAASARAGLIAANRPSGQGVDMNIDISNQRNKGLHRCGTRKSALRAVVKLWIFGALTTLVVACSSAASQRADRARSTEVGATRAALVNSAGSPTIERPVDRTSQVDPCVRDERNGRALEYDVPFDPLTGPILKWFNRPTVAERTVVCLDKESRVTSTHWLVY